MRVSRRDSMARFPESAARKVAPTRAEGERVGQLTLLARVATPGRAAWRCSCDCGAECIRSDEQLAAKRTPNCGEHHASASARSKHRAEYAVWKGMRARCGGDDPLYGGRGIKVCARWATSFEAFIADMGPRPSPKHSIERKRVNGDYDPGNCIWATSTVQNRNRRNVPLLTFQGRTMCRSAWAEHLGITTKALTHRLRHWPMARALSESRAA